MMELLKVENLIVSLKNGKQLIRSINFSIEQNEVVALVGLSGSGKSVLSESILGLLNKNKFNISGKVFFNGEDILKLSEKEKAKLRGSKISFVYQDSSSALIPVRRIEFFVKRIFKLHNKVFDLEKIKEIFYLLNFDDVDSLMKKFPYELSGGELQRGCFALSLLLEPELLIADEVTTALDQTTQNKLIEFISRIKKERALSNKNPLSVILITHDLKLAKKIADKIIIIKKGKIQESGTVDKIFNAPKSDATKELLAASFLDNANVVFDETETHKNSPLIEVNNLNFSYNEKILLQNISMQINSKGLYTLIGKSGCGKTTLIKLLSGVLPKTKAESEKYICYNKRSLPGKIQLVFQNPRKSFDPQYTADKILFESLRTQSLYNSDLSLSETERNNLYSEVLEFVNLPKNYLSRFPHEMSGGELQRLAIARAIISNPDIIFMDEPTASLDCVNKKIILQLILRLVEEKGISVFIVTHDLEIPFALKSPCFVLNQGQLKKYKTISDVFENPYV